ncbi:efflux RND transporter periplasmic adaptor subunit [Pseudodesulfovibrio indicus]|uniref:Cu(I)/Ag(I) efflux system membrane fusion protein n=1 Tax=Pseudodesulfovibrio indicus TaxID=1716143 RepID=A0A126QLS4_9BACT|nr:efflux RND transporter periplasmic adaptor subunit [Pseudodesulfovibrio indicus]AMK10797.1 efflux transporter periplasmic adaptor subunit [Pseudodesulfovibrio indicus]TDT91784.1 Cu(I)/Ag(I) efflux system membrane fusion protein [Pseudodesulfovibrio indicus]
MIRFRNPRMVTAILLLSLAAFAAGYLVKGASVPDMPAQVGQIEGDHDLEEHFDDKGNVIWTCSMHPQIQLPEPGKCPICFMELIPLKREAEGTRASVREITLTDSAQKLAGIATEAVRRLDVAVETRMVGKVDYDETRVRSITAWTGGRVDTMYVDYTGSRVKQGQPMVSIYSPELLTAQAELIQAIKAMEDLKGSNLNLVKESAKRTEEASREKLRLLGLTQRQIDKVASEGKAADHITLYAPQGGVVIRKDVNEGQYVKTGTSIYSVADLSTLWVVLEAYESDLPWIALGQQVEFQTEAYPGKMFKGKVVYIDPLVSEQTRTVRVRLEVGNKDGSLKPGMLVRATQQKEGGKKTAGESPLVIPASAPLITGKRAVVYVANPDKPGAFEGREIVLGPRAGNYYIVKSGLKEGDLVVTKGNFKIDSAVQIVARPSMMNPTSASTPVSEELPSLFVSKLALLDQSFESLSAAVGTGELDKTHLAFGQFNKDLRLIDGSSLEGVPALRWNEHSMLLGNDAILGAEAADGQRLNEIFTEMQGHYAALRKDFNLGDAQSLTAPEPFRQQLGLVYASYEPLAAALAVDDAEAARKAAARMSESLRLVDESGLSGPAHNVWRDALARMNDGLAAIRDAGDIVGIRTGFDPLSAGLSEAVLKLGVETDGPLFEIFCPMAFDYEGAVWLQRSEEVHNPYFGAAMSTCGEINKQLKR